MRSFVLSLAMLIALPATVVAHGLPLFIEADAHGKLQATQRVFWGPDGNFQPFGEAQQRFQAGFYVADPSVGIADGTVLTFNASGDPSAVGPQYSGQALLYWDGADVVPTDQTLTIIRSGNAIDVTENDTFVTGPVIGAYNAASLDWHGTANFFLPLNAPVGVYAIGLQVASPDYDSTDTFWVMANVGMSAEQYAQGVAALTSIVPEPSSVLMAGFAFAALLTVGRRRFAPRTNG